MKLSELLPQKVSFKLARLQDKEIVLNMITLADAAWLEEQYPGDELNKIFTEVRIKDLLKIIARIMTDDSKRFLGKAKIVEVDDFGDEKEVTGLTLADKLYRVLSDGELVIVFNALFDVRMKSQEIAINESEKLQKKTQAISELSGMKSTTSSPPSTELPLSNSVE
jgi:hypothetical protein